MALDIPFFDSKNGKVLLGFLISPFHLEFFHLVSEVLNKNFICSCRAKEGGEGGGRLRRDIVKWEMRNGKRRQGRAERGEMEEGIICHHIIILAIEIEWLSIAMH